MRTRDVLGVAGLVVGIAAIAFVVRQGRGDGGDVPTLFEFSGPTPTLQLIRNPTTVPELTFEDLDGQSISMSDLKGKVTLINFWATWCLPCREEIPAFVALQERYRDQLQIIGISADEGPVDEVRQFALEHKVNYPIVMQTPELTRSFPGVFALPTTFVVDPDGNTVQKHIGLISPVIYELETRVLTGLQADVRIEYVEDDGQVLLANAAQATEIPGVDLSDLTAEQRTAVLERLNQEECSCGCHLTVAQCRINDPTCGISPGIAERIVEEERQRPPSGSGV